MNGVSVYPIREDFLHQAYIMEVEIAGHVKVCVRTDNPPQWVPGKDAEVRKCYFSCCICADFETSCCYMSDTWRERNQRNFQCSQLEDGSICVANSAWFVRDHQLPCL